MRAENRSRSTTEADRRGLGWLTAGLGGAGLVVGLVVAPTDAAQGDAQRLMYLHVPAAWTAFAAFAVVALASGAYLTRRDLRWDRYARAAAEIGVGCTALAIALGAVWGKATWGAWWAWDPRLVSTTLLLIVYCGYLCVGRAGPVAGHSERARHRAATHTAFLGVAGFALVPVVHFSVVWWRSLHQPATILAVHGPPIDLLMGIALLLCVAAFTTGAAWVFLRRVDALERAAAASRTAGRPTLRSGAR
ncbi:cytochrome c biogenesis protein CcsA [Micromonospora sp. NPDC049679]|uniref:cytochrome c biogenesis protein CcsA n=1 Tax=Micromonospora sp. NPDC049679 TaxID=3155920 RepID=UPI00340C3CC5